MFEQTCAFLKKKKKKFINLTGLSELFLQDEPALCVKYFPCFERNINTVFPVHVALSWTLCLSVRVGFLPEWMTPFLLFECYEILVALKKPGSMFTLAVIAMVLFSVWAVPSPLLTSLLIHGWIQMEEAKETEVYSGLQFISLCFSLKTRLSCLSASSTSSAFCLCPSSSWEVRWFHQPSCFYFLNLAL